MTNNKYERLIMLAIIVGVIGILGFSEYWMAQKSEKKDTPVVEKASHDSALETYKNIEEAKDAEDDLKKMSQSEGRDHSELIAKTGTQENGTEEEKRESFIRFGSDDVEKNQ